MEAKVEGKQCASCSRSFRTELDYLSHSNRWRICRSDHLWFNCECGSTLMIPKGKFPWYSPEKTMGEKATSLFNTLSNKKLIPRVSTVINELSVQVADPDLDALHLARVLKQSPILAVEVLNAANARKRAKDGKTVESLQHAVSYLGRKYLQELVLMAGLRSFSFFTKDYRQITFWNEALVAGAISENLLTALGPNFK